MTQHPFPLSWHAACKILLFITIVVAANFLAHAIADGLDFRISPSNDDMVHRAIMTSAAVYTLLLAAPFVPGAEIGIAMMVLLGPQIAFLVYVCTVTGLVMSFLLGRLIPLIRLAPLAEDFRLRRLADLLRQIEPLKREDIPAFLASNAPNRYIHALLQYRYLALAVLLNVPGNFLIGGGGGIALMAGISRLYSLPGVVIMVAIAVSPVPVAVTIFGNEFLTR